MSLVGILTAIDGLLQSISDNFNRLGANSFSIERSFERIQTKTKGRQFKQGEPIAFKEAMEFKERFDYPASKTAVSFYCGGGKVVKFRKDETNQNINIVGIDENYLEVSAFELDAGRGFAQNEITYGSNKVIIGAGLVNKLFNGKPEKAMDKTITVDDNRYKVVGALKSKGSTFGDSNDRRVFIPISKARTLYSSGKTNYSIQTSINNQLAFDEAMSQAIGIMRSVRQLRPIEPLDFDVKQSSSIMNRLKDLTKTLRLATIAIGLMTLVGAAIGLMNIMLVTVTERTREIGVSKALGATKRNILIQFLTEAITITMLGGIIGIILGIIIGNGVTFYIGQSFIFPFAWVALGFIVCIFTGVLSGLYPALKASSLDPIESLRYE